MAEFAMRNRDPDNLLTNLRISSPCPMKWHEMTGTDQVRFCHLCKLNVYNISEMTADEATQLLINGRGSRTCVRFYRRSDGTVLTQGCPKAWRSFKRGSYRVWQLIVTSLCWLVGATGVAKDEVPNPEKVKLTPGAYIDVLPKVLPDKCEIDKGKWTTGAVAAPNYEPEYGQYLEKVRSRIKSKWIHPARLKGKKIVVDFKVQPDGNLSGLRLLQSAGLATYDNMALNAVRAASPFERLPESKLPRTDDINIQFTFDEDN